MQPLLQTMNRSYCAFGSQSFIDFYTTANIWKFSNIFFSYAFTFPHILCMILLISVIIGAPKKSQEAIAEALPKFHGNVFNNLIFYCILIDFSCNLCYHLLMANVISTSIQLAITLISLEKMNLERSIYIPRTCASCPPNNLAGTWLTAAAVYKVKFVKL